MTEDIESYSEKLRLAGFDTAAAHDGLMEIVSAVERAANRSINGAGPDKFGRRFTNGKEGFRNTMDSIATGTRNKADSFEKLSEGQFNAAAAIEAREKSSEEDFRRI